jgi:XTP/dITP diphosphohydrolase
MTDLLIATTNPGKIVEIQDLLEGLPFRLLLPADLSIRLEVAETGQTYAENAALKAEAYYAASGILTLADDSGLEVAALDGAPGLHSARYSPQPGAKDADRRALLLRNLTGKPQPWLARFVCAVVIAVPGGPLQFAEGECRGEILPEERGSNGFGYDPIFYLAGLGRTMAELTRAEKNTLSHRARAVQAALPILKGCLKEG